MAASVASPPGPGGGVLRGAFPFQALHPWGLMIAMLLAIELTIDSPGPSARWPGCQRAQGGLASDAVRDLLSPALRRPFETSRIERAGKV